jgi:hypothetical protein
VLDACVRGGSLSVNVPVRDLKAEEARDERLEREAERQLDLTKTAKSKLRQEISRTRGKPIYRDEPQMIGTVAGLAFFVTNTPWPHEAIPDCVARMEASLLTLSLPPDPNTGKLRAHIKAVHDAIAGFIEQISILSSLPEAFSAQNLALVARWGNAWDEFKPHTAKDFGLSRRALWGDDGGEVTYPAGYQVPSRQPFEAFRKAVEVGI